MDLAKYGPWALITGGSEGVGGCFIKQVGREGANVALIARISKPLGTAKEVRDERGARSALSDWTSLRAT